MLLISMGMLESVLHRLPLSPAMFYLPVGYLLGPAGIGLIAIDPLRHAGLLKTIAEIALLISLFSVGLKLRVPLSDRLWWLPVRLGTLAMVATIMLIAAFGVWLLKLPLGAAILLGAILAPTDPILASDVQIQHVGDHDRIRFSLSGEAGLNDGTTYPFIMLGLGLLGVPEGADYTGPWAAAWIVWGFFAGVGCGWAMGASVGRLVVRLRRDFKLALGMEEFLTLGLIALSYGLANFIHGIGFIAVFATGVAIRRVEYAATGESEPAQVLGAVAVGNEYEVATDPVKASAYMTEMVLGFNEQLEHIAEFIVVLLLGMLLSSVGFSAMGVVLAILLFFLARPLSLSIALTGARVPHVQRVLMSWFGIRGIGSVYYLLFALQYSASHLTQSLMPLVLTVVAISVVVHGISATPLMARYARRKQSRRPFSAGEEEL